VITDVQLERKRWRAAYPNEFDDGFEIGFFGKAKSARDPAGGDYPLGFHGWSLNRKNAWFSGSNLGYVKRLRTDCEIGVTQARLEADALSDAARTAPCLPLGYSRHNLAKCATCELWRG
jgi:hypothetical protein